MTSFLHGRRGVTALLACLALLATFLQAPPARAEAALVPADRAQVLTAWEAGGPQVKAQAEAALVGTDDQIRDFLATGMQQAALVDPRDAVATGMLEAGPAVRAASEAALAAFDAGDTEALNTFIVSGRRGPENSDLRLRVNQLMATGGTQVQAAAQAALDSQDPEVLQAFVDSGWQPKWQIDLRMRVNQALASGGPEVQKAAQRALDTATTAAYDQFLSYDWDAAAARDEEKVTMEGLLALAQEAAATVERETKNAQDQAGRAAAAAAAAKRSADVAKAATQQAKNDAAAAKAHALRAAKAARQAADAAQVAMDAAAAAKRAAQKALKAANQAYWAAGKAADAASDAYHAANRAMIDRASVDAAQKAADKALAISRSTTELAEKAKQAATVLAALQSAMVNADAAGYNAQAAADSSDEAQGYANQTGAAAERAKRHAATARANALRAQKALASARKYMQIAIDNALAARDAAISSAENAKKAAAAALAAVAWAGTAQQAAIKATEYAESAVVAAQQVVNLGVKAVEVYNAARDADKERLDVATEAATAAALELKEQYDAVKQQADWDADQATKRDAETNQLIALAKNPATDQASAVTASRKAAIALAQKPGEWTKQAALDALSADDNLEVLAFARTRLDKAVAQDNRVAVAEMAASDNTALANAAVTALGGTDAQVAGFLSTQDYAGRIAQDRTKINQILSAAAAADRKTTAERAQAALDIGTLQAFQDFLSTGQFEAAAIDDRMKANQLISNPDVGPEVKAAAQVALDGPPTLLTQFLSTGQFEAAERDNANAVHIATVAGLMEQIYALGMTSLQHAQEAQSVAWRARGDATKATNYANQAIASAQQAATYANNAASWANKAANSANNAVKSANTAQRAATSADSSARSALRAAAWASALHEQAKTSAKNADYFADQAAKAARDAGKTVEEIQRAADEADQRWIDGVAGEAYVCYAENSNEFQRRFDNWLWGGSDVPKNCLNNALANPDELAERAWGNVTWCKILYPQGMASQDFQNCKNNVLDPNFKTLALSEWGAKIITGMTVMLTPALIAGGVGCLIMLPCGATAGALLSLADFGTTLYGLVSGDVTLTDALKKLGVNLLQNLAFAGAVKLASSTYRGLKAVLKLEKGAKAADETLSKAGIQQLVLSCGVAVAGTAGFKVAANTRAEFTDGQWVLVNQATGESCPLRGTPIPTAEFAKDGLSRLATQWRFNNGVEYKTLRNVGGVRLTDGVRVTPTNNRKNNFVVDGNTTYIFAISDKDKDFHSETYLDAILKEHGLTWRDVDELYTERSPCKRCSSIVPTEVPVSYGLFYFEGLYTAKETAEDLGRLIRAALDRDWVERKN